jgi:hypothetical protein
VLSTTARAAIIAVGVVLTLSGLGAASLGGGISALWLTLTGVVLVVAALVERQRYRSEAADKPFEPIGPGGGEPAGAIEPRFRPTDELFVDPTTQHTMRVYVDPRSGERRYVAEGSQPTG